MGGNTGKDELLLCSDLVQMLKCDHNTLHVTAD